MTSYLVAALLILTGFPALSQTEPCKALLVDPIVELALISTKWEQIHSSHPPFETIAYINSQPDVAYYRPDSLAYDLSNLYGDLSWGAGRRFVAELNSSGYLLSKPNLSDGRKRGMFATEAGRTKYLSFINSLNISEETVKKYISFLSSKNRDYNSKVPLDLTLFILKQTLKSADGISPSRIVSNFVSEVDMSTASISRAMKSLLEDGYVESRVSTGDQRRRNYFSTEKGLKLLEDITSAQ